MAVNRAGCELVKIDTVGLPGFSSTASLFENITGGEPYIMGSEYHRGSVMTTASGRCKKVSCQISASSTPVDAAPLFENRIGSDTRCR